MAQRMRRIVVDGVAYRWRFDDVLVVIPADRSGPQLYVDWGWHDWLEPGGPGAEPQVVTPRFVATAIRFAAARGWPSALGGRPLPRALQGGNCLATAKSAEYQVRRGRPAMAMFRDGDSLVFQRVTGGLRKPILRFRLRSGRQVELLGFHLEPGWAF